MNSAEYWERRLIEERANAIKDEAKIRKKVDKLYRETFKEIEKDIMTLFKKYASENNLTYKEATMYLTSREFSEWRMDLNEYIELIEKTGDERLLLELNTLAMKSRISRLEQLSYQVNKSISGNFEHINKTVEELMTRSVSEAYSQSSQDINFLYKKNVGGTIARQKVRDILIQPWSGSTFSDDIWGNRDKLVKVVQSELTKGIYQGKSSQKICNEISKRMEGSKKDIMRVVRTERSYAQNRGKLEQYKDIGFKKYKYKAAIGQNRTCEKCRKIHKETEEEPIEFEKAIIGENFPPLHTNCRCTIVPVADELVIEDTEEPKEEVKEFDEDRIKSKNRNVKILSNKLEKAKVKYNKVELHETSLSEEEIIKTLGGGDKTGGSCASVGLAYVGQKGGLNVTDFRGGQSKSILSLDDNLKKVVAFSNTGIIKQKAKSSVSAGKRLLNKMEKGKEYYLAVGRHASIVRKTEENVLQYLELQSPVQCGWKDFEKDIEHTLIKRFGCSIRENPWKAEGYMTEVEGLKDSEELRVILGYINTVGMKEMKGATGHVR